MIKRIFISAVFAAILLYLCNHQYFKYYRSYRYNPAETAINFESLNRVNGRINAQLNNVTETKFFSLFKLFADSP